MGINERDMANPEICFGGRMDERNIAKNIFGCSRNNSVLCNGRVENTCFMAHRIAGAAQRLGNGISKEKK